MQGIYDGKKHDRKDRKKHINYIKHVLNNSRYDSTVLLQPCFKI